MVLDHDPGLLAPDAGLVVPMPAWTSETLAFVGREVELDRASAALRAASRDGFRLLLLEAEAGHGKSRFLLEIARRFGRDAIVVPVDVHEPMCPSVIALMRSLAAAARRLTREELDLVLVSVPDLAAVLGPHAPSQERVLGRAASWLAALSAKAPVVLLVDDLDRASASLLHVIGQLFAVDVKRVLVLASAGSDGARNSQSLRRLIDELAERSAVDRVQLGPLTADDIITLLERMEIAPGTRQRITPELVELTSGNPFMIAELLNTAPPEHLAEQWEVPPRVRDVVLARLDSLGRTTGDALKVASVFEHEFTASLLSEILELPESAAATIIARALAAQMLQPSGLHTYRFTHQLARRTIAESLSREERVDAHRHAAIAIERAGGTATDLAFHWGNADGSDAADKAVEYARRAGDEAKHMLEPANAVHWYELALSHLDDDVRRGPLLAALAEARYQAGNPDFVVALREAARIALDGSDADLIVRVATLASPAWVILPGMANEEVLPLLDRALDVAEKDEARSRVLARTATERAGHDAGQAQTLAFEALELARRSGDQEALLDALSRHASMLHSPDSVSRRRQEVDEALAIAEAMHDDLARYYLTSAGIIAAVQAVDVAGIERYVEIADSIATSTSLPPLVWNQRVRRAWRAGLAGRFGEAERLIHRTREYGIRDGVAHADVTSLLQLAQLRWHQCRVSEVVPSARDALSRLGGFPGVKFVLVRALASDEAGRAEARHLLHEVASADLDDLPRGTFWSTIMVIAAESTWLLEEPRIAAILRPMFDSCVEQVACNGAWVAAPIAQGAAAAAAAMGAADADELFELAITVAERLGSPFLRARAQLAWVEAAIRSTKHRPTDADALCADVITIAQTLDLPELERRAEALRVAAH